MPTRSSIEESLSDSENPTNVYVDCKPPASDYLVRKRGSRAKWAMIVVLMWYLGYLLWALSTNNFMPTVILADNKSQVPNTADHVTYAICVLGFSLLFLLGGELLYRGFLLAEEVSHLRSRYHNNVTEALVETFSMKLGLLPLFLGLGWCTSLMIMCGIVPDAFIILANFWNLNGAVMWTHLIMNSIVFALIGLRGPSRVEVSRLLEKNHLNVAHGLAWSYYFGYLRFVAPGFRERVLNRAAEMNIAGELIPRLVLLIPESCYAFDTLPDADENISFQCHLDFRKNRGGNVARTFNQTMYCIQTKLPRGETKKDCYCVAEYVTPLMALHEMVEAPEAGMTRGQMQEQMLLFYTTLRHIINLVPEVAQNVLLIPYKDKTSHGHHCHLSKIIISHATKTNNCY